ncbi:TIGR04104 family putative zinc finger protein [Metabacillus halosaccharovorans]|uniref:TIGR04104 family putative zinc finger protein n=1 Tax=Metabacillus halosaccharovorans TaxID=930124 RepID=UPI001C1F9D73|nr:hypothetical protein [Metabacillus halosaccharovorans]
MQKCQKCNLPFGWKNIYRSFWGCVYKPIICDKCSTKHRITFQGRFIVTFLTTIPMLIFINFLSLFNNAFLTLGVGLFIAFIGSLIAPYLVRFKDTTAT